MSIQNILIEMTHLEGKQVYGDIWNDVSWTEIEAFIGLILLAGVYRSRNEALTSLWEAETGRSIFQAVTSLKKFQQLARIIRFDNKSRSTGDWQAGCNLWGVESVGWASPYDVPRSILAQTLP